MQYEDRYVALIDIIGFSSWILSDKTDTCAATLTAIYAEIRKALLPPRGARPPRLDSGNTIFRYDCPFHSRPAWRHAH